MVYSFFSSKRKNQLKGPFKICMVDDFVRFKFAEFKLVKEVLYRLHKQINLLCMKAPCCAHGVMISIIKHRDSLY